MLTLAIFVIDVFILCESYEPILLARKASRLRAEFEEWTQRVTLRYHINKFALRPFVMLATPICFFISVYASFIFGVFYASLAAFPVIYEQGRGWNKLVGSFPFFALLVGIGIGSVVVALNQKYYKRRYQAS